MPSGNLYHTRGLLGVTDRRHLSAALIMSYLEKRREIRVVAEYVGEQSIPKPCCPETNIVYVGFWE